MPQAASKPPSASGREATQFKLARPGAASKSHNVNMSAAAHAAFSKLSPQQRGDLIEAALK